MFTKTVDYRTYRLINKSSEYTDEVAQKITKHHKKLSFQMGDTTFTGQSYYLLQGRLRGNTLAIDEDGTEMLESHPEVVNYLLETYATDDIIQENYSEVLAYHQRSGQTESEFSLAPWNLATRCGNVFTTSRLKSLFADNVDKAIRSQVRNYLATTRKVDYNGLARYFQGLGDTLRLGKRPAMPATSNDKSKRLVWEIEDTTTSEGSSHIEVPTGTTIHLVAIQGRFSKPSTLVHLKVRLQFFVVDGLPTDCLLDTNFIDRHVNAILPGSHTVALRQGGRIAILGNTETKRGWFVKPKKTISTETVSNKVRITKQVIIRPVNQILVPVSCATPGLVRLQNHPSNFSSHDVKLPKNTNVGIAVPAPQGVFTAAHTDIGEVAFGKEGGCANASTATKVSINTNLEAKLTDKASVDKKEKPDPERQWQDTVQIGEENGQLRGRIIDLLVEFETMWSGYLGQIKATQHCIELLSDSNPIYQQPYRAGPKARDVEFKEVERTLQEGVIEPANSDWASPVVLVHKKGSNRLRFCVDDRRLNSVTVRDSYPIPRMDECIDSLGDAQISTTLDANCGYWQVPVATFQRALDIIPSKVKRTTALVYIDDVIIYSRSVEEDFAHVCTVQTLLAEAGVTLKLRKCVFFTRTVEYLGHIIGPGTLEVSPSNIRAVLEVKLPRSQTDVRSFIGLCNVYRRFVKGFAKIEAPLNKKLQKSEPEWFENLSNDEMDTFEELKRALLSPPILALPKTGLPYTLDTDASHAQIGCYLIQEQHTGDKLPIEYWSRAMNEAEQNYTVTEKECLAVVWSMLMLRPYMYGERFTLRTDHDSSREIL
ncbi:unnamed protein product [Agarophyton chilense]